MNAKDLIGTLMISDYSPAKDDPVVYPANAFDSHLRGD